MADGGQWRYFAQRFDGTGNLGDFVDLNIPLEQVSISEVLSGHNALSAVIAPEISRMRGSDGKPLFGKWGTCLWAESPSGEVYGGILERSGYDGPEWSVEAVDISGVFIDTPFDDALYFVNVDPIDVFRYIWLWYQSRPGCNFGVTTDMTASPVRLGTEYTQVEDFDQEAVEDPTPTSPSSYATNAEWVAKAAKKLHKKYGYTVAEVTDALNDWLATMPGDPTFTTKRNSKIVKRARTMLGDPPDMPGGSDDVAPTVNDPKVYQVDAYKLNWYETTDLSSVLDSLATDTPFDWHLIHRWSDEGDEADLQHHLRIGWPRLGRTITDLRFVIGENIHEIPSVEDDGEDYANEILVIGNGEGAAAVRGRAYRPTPGKMRRTKLITDQSLKTIAECNARAEAELAARAGDEDITEVIIVDHPHAPLGSVQLGDEFLLEGDTGWIDMSMWVRCVGRTFSPDDGSQMTLSLIRSDR